MMSAFQINNFQSKWIAIEIDELCIEFMQGLGLFLCDKTTESERPGRNAVTTSQLRNIFSEVKRIDVKLNDESQFLKEKSNILLLRPKIAYNTARVLSNRRDSRMKEFREVLEKALTAIKSLDDFKRFSQFLEGIIAYHKVYGGKD